MSWKKVHPAARYARPHTACLTLGKIEKMGWKVLLHPPYSHDLTPSGYNLFGIVTNEMRGHHYEKNEALQTVVRQCLRAAGTEFYRKGIFKLPERW
jgi:histone-lysine N-methyltransferase SETMAR